MTPAKLLSKKGFTLIELLVVIAIIGILSAVVIASINSARTKGKIAKTQLELGSIEDAILLLADDTGKWPNGCGIGEIQTGATGNEVAINSDCAGLLSIAQDICLDHAPYYCEWTVDDVANWNGPYINTYTDAWGNNYYFDTDYNPYYNCLTEPALGDTVVVHSTGPDGSAVNLYDCDNIHLDIVRD